MSGPFLGYRQVESFGPDGEYEDEVEECYITLDLGGIEPTLVPSSSSYRLIGLDSPTPFLQLSGTILRGTHQTLLGTELLFVNDADNPTSKDVQHVASSEHRIRFKEVLLKPKAPNVEKAPPEEPFVNNGAEAVADVRMSENENVEGVYEGRSISKRSRSKGKAKEVEASEECEPRL